MRLHRADITIKTFMKRPLIKSKHKKQRQIVFMKMILCYFHKHSLLEKVHKSRFSFSAAGKRVGVAAMAKIEMFKLFTRHSALTHEAKRSVPLIDSIFRIRREFESVRDPLD